MVPLYRYLPHQAFLEDGITCFHQPVPCACIVMSWPGYIWTRAWETGDCGEKKNVQSKVRTRGWKGDCKLIPFGYSSLKKGYSVIPFLLIQIATKIIHVFNISKVCSIYIVFLITCKSPERKKGMAGILIVEGAQVLWSNSNFSSNSLVAR